MKRILQFQHTGSEPTQLRPILQISDLQSRGSFRNQYVGKLLNKVYSLKLSIAVKSVCYIGIIGKDNRMAREERLSLRQTTETSKKREAIDSSDNRLLLWGNSGQEGRMQK